MSKRTPGLWYAVIAAKNEHWRGDGTEVGSEYGRIADCGCNGLRDISECQANARLIAAAPELLEALRLTMDCVETGDEISDAVRNMASAALAKANGEGSR